MADAADSAPKGPKQPFGPGGGEPDVRPYARRLFWPGGLSSRLLVLTVLIVTLGGMLVMPWSMAQFEANWLQDRIRLAETAARVVDASPNQVVSNRLTDQLLQDADVLSIAVQSDGVRTLVLAPPRFPHTPYLVDLRGGFSLDLLAAPFETLFSGKDRMVRVLAKPQFGKDDFIEIVTTDERLQKALLAYLWRISIIAVIVATVVGGLIYLLLNALFVQPMQRITGSMERFRVDPDDPLARPRLSGRRDEIGRAEAELDRMQADLRAALNSRARLAALGAAVARINHDLRNMLTSAQIASERLALSGDPKVAQALPRLERALDRAIHLASDVLAYGRSDEAAPSLASVHLAEAVEDAAEDAGLTPASVRLASKIGARARVQADPEHLHRILVNLLRNAREAITAGGKPAGEGRVDISLEKLEAHSLIRIRDNGPGVPERVRERLFQPFSGTTRQGGAGLGLAISRELAQGHGGDLVLVETSAEGTVFELTLPNEAKA